MEATLVNCWYILISGLVSINVANVQAVPPPTVTRVQRTSDTEATVTFKPQFQEGQLEISYFIAGNVSTPDLVSSPVCML